MRWAFFLHFYQPPTQYPEVLAEISSQCYVPIISLLKRYPRAKLTININASLTEQLSPRLRLGIKELAEAGQIEFSGSAAYHPLLSYLPPQQVRRQIELNNQINTSFFGDAYAPRGFFPPEMDYAPEVGKILKELGFQWVLLDEMGRPGGAQVAPLQDRLVRDVETGLICFFRAERLSLDIAFARTTSLAQVGLRGRGFVVTAMDGETFGHHHPGQLRFLEEILAAGQAEEFELVTLSDLISRFKDGQELKVEKSTWGEGWDRWDNPQNPIHHLQWELFRRAVSSVEESKSKGAQLLLDKAVHSDQFWWASHTPCWHYQLVERGARMLRDTVLATGVSDQGRAEQLYTQIVETGERLYGTGVIEG